MPTVRPSGAGNEPVGTGEVVNGGTIFHCGNPPSGGPVINSVPTSTSSNNNPANTGILTNDGTGADTTDRVGISGCFPLTSGTVGYNPPSDQWIMRGGGVTTTLSNVPFSGFITPGTDWDGQIHDNLNFTSGNTGYGSGNTFDAYATPNGTITPNWASGETAGSGYVYTSPSGEGGSGVYDSSSFRYTDSVTFTFGGIATTQTVGSGEPTSSGTVTIIDSGVYVSGLSPEESGIPPAQ